MNPPPQPPQPQFQQPPAPPAAPSFPPQGQPGFPPPAQFQPPPQQPPAPVAPQGSFTDPTLTKIQQDVESLRAQLAASEQRSRTIETALIYFIRGMTGRAGANTAEAFVADFGLQVPSR